jgi:hypothetical protein
MTKLSINISDHRICEIFAKCKKKGSKDQTELDEEGN